MRVVEGVPTVFGSPWSGKTPCYRNESYPIAAFVRLAQAPHNRIARLPVVRAIGALLPSCPPAFAYDAQLQDNICDTLSQLIARVPVYQLEAFLRGIDAAIRCQRGNGLFQNKMDKGAELCGVERGLLPWSGFQAEGQEEVQRAGGEFVQPRGGQPHGTAKQPPGNLAGNHGIPRLRPALPQ